VKLGRLGLAAQLALVFVLFAAGILLVLGLLAYGSGRAGLQAATESELLSKAVDIETALDRWVAERRSDLTIFASSPDLLNEMEALAAAAPNSGAAAAAHAQLVRALQPHAGAGRPYLVVLVLDPVTAQVLAATDPTEEGKYRENQPYFLNGRNGPYVQNVYYSTTLQRPAMTVSAPLRAADGRLVAVLAGRIDLAEMNAIVQARTGLRQTDEAFLVNSAHLIVTLPRQAPNVAVLQHGLYTAAVNQCLTQTSGVTSAPDYRGVPALIVYRWLPERKMCLIVKLDQAEAFASVWAFG